MSVRVIHDCRIGYNGALDDLVAGQEIAGGPFADYLLSTGAPVERLGEPEQAEPTGAPPVNAPKSAWVDHVVEAHGLDADEANALTKNDLIELAKGNGGPDDASGLRDAS